MGMAASDGQSEGWTCARDAGRLFNPLSCVGEGAMSQAAAAIPHAMVARSRRACARRSTKHAI
eukprot:4857006-Pleurochrysis_carterae.AAC.1